MPSSTSAPTTLDPPSILTHNWTTPAHTLTPHQIISYNLALGSPGTHLPAVYELHPQFQPLPSFAAIFAIQAMSQVHSAMHTFLPNFLPHNHVHGEHFLQLHRPYPTSGSVTTTARVVDVSARRSGVLLAVEIVTTESATGSKICTQEWTSFVLKVPGEGAPSTPKDRGIRTKSYKISTDQKPDAVRTYTATAEQGALYRAASGDLNPLHIDPETASKAGFPKPIMTGTCTIGVGVRLVMEALGQGRTFGSVKCRLTRPVFAGDEVRVEMWKMGEGEVVYRMVVDEEGGKQRMVIDGAGLHFAKQGENAKL